MSTLPFSKIGKSALILVKNTLIVVIYGLNFSFKIQLRKSRRFFLVGPFFVWYMIVYKSILISRKLPCPQKFLVMHM